MDNELLQLDRAQLDALFGSGRSGAIPDGEAQGTAIMLPGSKYNGAIAQFVSAFLWQGKTFYAKYRVLANRITPLGLHAVAAVVYEDASWLDDKPCIVLDYSMTSLVARFIRDEIREIAPNRYIGQVYWGKLRTFAFSLDFNATPRR